MREAYATGGGRPNSAPHDRAVRNRTDVRKISLTAELMRAAHDVFGVDRITKSLARHTARSPRTVEYWLADQRAMDLESFHRLACADPAFLDAFLDTLPLGVRESWLRAKILEARLAKAELRAASQRQEIEQLKLELNGRR